MLDTHYENSKLADVYDLDSPWSIDRDFYLSLAGDSKIKILDLGCGTGLLCDVYASKNHEVTGVDPSLAMLKVGRRKTHGDRIEWVQSFAQTYHSEKLFDLIVMTGHAFQVLLDDADILATFATMRKHLNSSGLIAFESRNPNIDWRKQWDYEMVIEMPNCVVHESRRFVSMNRDKMTFDLRYQFPDETLVSKSELRFLSRKEIEERLIATGLFIEKILGDWDNSPFEETISEEMIFLVRTR
jgi:SAM-dependent methyltransferase